MWIVQSATPTLEFELKTMSSSRTMGRKILTEDCPKTIGATKPSLVNPFEVFGWIGVVFCAVSRPGGAVKITTICD